MDATKIHGFARASKGMSGAKAGVDATQKASECERSGDAEQAETWRRLAAALQGVRGTRESWSRSALGEIAEMCGGQR